jgi:gamma-glutamyltranspeptidase/glutathione hydrolase
LLNDEIDDFAILAGSPNEYGLVGGAANALAPGKRPLSSMTPTIVRDGGQVVKLVLGSPGGPRIITSVLGVLLRTVVYGQDLAAAVAAPRLHQQWSPSATKTEPGWDEVLLQGLKNSQHVLECEKERWGSVQAIEVEVGGEPVGVSDPRSGGSAGRAKRKE